MSLKNKIRKQRNFINLDSNRQEMERPIVDISEERKRDLWKTFIKSHRATAHTSTTTIFNTTGKSIGTKKHITLSLFTELKASSNVAMHVAQRTIERIDGNDKATSDIIEFEHGYEQYIAIVDRPFEPEMNESIELVFVTEYIDPKTGRTEGKYVQMTQKEAAKHRRKMSNESKAGIEFVENLMADPKNREAFSEFLNTRQGNK